MLVFPLKWLPYLMVIAGIAFLFSGEDFIWGILLIAAGGFWIYKRYKNKSNNNSNNSNNNNNNNFNSFNNIPAERTYTSVNEPKKDTGSTVVFCDNCGSKLVEGASFCSECGKRLNKS